MQTVDDLIPDDDNANQGTERGAELLGNAIRSLGTGRSILIDSANRVIGGNKVLEAAKAVGIKGVRVIESDGSELIAVRRTDVQLDTKEGRELAIADNAIALRNTNLDGEVLERQRKALELDLDLAGVSAGELQQLIAASVPADERSITVTPIKLKDPPAMAWVLIGIPTVRYGDVAPHVEACAQLPGVIIETSLNDKMPADEAPTESSEEVE